MDTAIGAANETAYQDSPSRSLTTTGIAVSTANDSKANRNASAKIPAVVAPSRPVQIDSRVVVTSTTQQPQLKLRSTGNRCYGCIDAPLQ